MKLPNFFIVGAARAGTTSLYNYLNQHPDIFMCPIKEPNYFSLTDLNTIWPDAKYQLTDNDLKYYINGSMKKQIQLAVISKWENYVQLFKNVKNESRIGEASTTYLPSLTAPKLIKKQIPEAKIIICLRNPISRAFSLYLSDLRLNLIHHKINFLDAMKLRPHNLENGLYYKQIKHFLQFFNQKDVKIVLFDDLKNNPRNTVSEIFRFLEVDAEFKIDLNVNQNQAKVQRFPVISEFLIKHPVFAKKSLKLLRLLPLKVSNMVKSIILTEKNLPKLNNDEKKFLKNYYEEDVKKLSIFLDRDLSHWLS